MDDPVTFAQDRLDEDEREIRNDPPDGMGYAILPVRMLRDVKAGLRILARHRDCASGAGYCDRWVGPGPCPDLADLLVRWADHPTYGQEWKP